MKVRKKGRILDWIKKRKKIIIAVSIVWVVVILINYVVGNQKPIIIDTPKTTYEPNTPIISTKYDVPKKEQDNIINIIDEFIDNCNNKEYDKAFKLISEDCKNIIFHNNINEFKEYINNLFDEKKIYDIQNLSNDKNLYIYRLRLLDDFLAKGVKSKSELQYKQQEISLSKVNNEFKISILNFIKSNNLNKEYDDEYINVKINNSEVYYDCEVYNVTIKNKSDKTVVLCDNLQGEEILLNIGNETREVREDSIYAGDINLDVVIKPNETKEFRFKFVKFFDEYASSVSIQFDKVRVFEKYTGKPENLEEELNNAVKKYAFEITF